MSKRRIIILALVCFFIANAVLIRFWFGIYRHDEFAGEKYIFLKHRPSWKWHFYSPIGMGSRTLEDLDEQQTEDQLLFWEFVRDQGMSR